MSRVSVPEELVLIAEWAAKISGLVTALTLAWMLNGLLSGATAPGAPDPARVQRILGTAGNYFQLAACACALTLAVLTYAQRDVALYLGLVGVVMTAGLPALIHYQIGRTMPGRPVTLAEQQLNATFVQTGTFVTAVALVRGTLHLLQGVVEFGQSLRYRATVGVQKHAQQNTMQARTPTLFSPCWKLPYCRDPVRALCPAWHAKKTCWKFGGGCYCDDDLLMKVILAESGSEGTAYMFQALKDMKVKGRKRPPCEKCYIFLEHQRLKHALLSPLVVPFTIGLLYVGYPVYQMAFAMVTRLVLTVWQAISFAPSNVTTAQAVPWFATMETLFAVLTGFFVLVYLTRALEFAIFKLRF